MVSEDWCRKDWGGEFEDRRGAEEGGYISYYMFDSSSVHV